MNKTDDELHLLFINIDTLIFIVIRIQPLPLRVIKEIIIILRTVFHHIQEFDFAFSLNISFCKVEREFT